MMYDVYIEILAQVLVFGCFFLVQKKYAVKRANFSEIGLMGNATNTRT